MNKPIPCTFGCIALLLAQFMAGFASAPRQIVLFDTLVDPARVGEAALSLGAQPLLVVYENYEGADPDAARTGNIDVPSLLRHIDRVTAGRAPEWGLLDFEAPFMEWIERGPGDDRWSIATGRMVAAIKAVKRVYPKTKWSYYQLPYVRYWIEGKSWAEATPEIRQRAADRYLSQCKPVLEECDWICPSIYCFYDPSKAGSLQGAVVRNAGRMWRMEQIRIARQIAGARPVIPIISPIWQTNGDAPVGSPVPLDQLRLDVIEPALKSGSSGFILWTAFGYFIDCAISGKKPTSMPEFDRTVMVKHYLDGKDPPNWSDPSVVATIRARAGAVVLDAIKAIRDCEASTAARPLAEPGSR